MSERFKKIHRSTLEQGTLMCTYINLFLLYSVSSKCQISHRESKNGFKRTSFCASKVIQEVFFPQIFSQFCTGGSVLVHLYCVFSLRCQMAPQQSAKFRTAFLVDFVPVWGRIASPVMLAFGRCFHCLLED